MREGGLGSCLTARRIGNGEREELVRQKSEVISIRIRTRKKILRGVRRLQMGLFGRETIKKEKTNLKGA